ncbi:isoprenylcysteine carboxylmethyltransferase family protein [Frigidibacter sp. SD6-1]|uniref:methyltransferase family protein n=1 Tax=Frigidibacter sp. SD6-1 TaxID=3032581 RepID=UPI0024DF6F90|nr:isoprenylcysteine carboxylmethyltransferase family protein [Frigidibacter sp. SD6-1]
MVFREVDYPPVWLAGFAMLGGALGSVLPLQLPFAPQFGALIVIVALAMLTLAALQMMQAGTTVIPHRNPTRLVTRGLFSLSRNPIYLADAIFLTGLFVSWGAWIALPLVPSFMRLISRRFIEPEEARLARVFGEDYFRYQEATRRWI